MTQAQQAEALRVADKLNENADLDAAEGGNPDVCKLERDAAILLQTQHARILELEQGKCLHQIAGPVAEHIDDLAVGNLAYRMKAKLAKQRENGYGGWDTDCTQERLSELLRQHVDKGDPVDVANFCAFLLARGEGIAAAPQAVQAAVLEGAMGLLEALESMVDVCEGHDFDGAPSDAHMDKARSAILAYRAALAATQPAAQGMDAPNEWNGIESFPTCDDPIWLYCQDTNTVDGPVTPNPVYEDCGWTHWAYANAPSTSAINAALAAQAKQGGA